MSVNLEEISTAPLKALTLVEDPERRKILKEFLVNVTPFTESATRKFLEQLTREINSRLGSEIQLRLIFEDCRVSPEISMPSHDSQKDWVNNQFEYDSISNVLLRIPESVKAQAKKAAQKTGLSLNKWAVYTLQRGAKNLDSVAENLRRTQSQEMNPEPTEGGQASST